MKVNWKVRFKNGTWLSMFFSLIIGFVFNMLKLFDVVPVITENQVLNIVQQFLMLLGLFGVIVDPTTSGLNDSQRAMSYSEPWTDGPTHAIPDEPDPEEGTVIVDTSKSES